MSKYKQIIKLEHKLAENKEIAGSSPKVYYL